MICDFCRTAVLQAGRTWGYHHNTLAGLQRSAHKQCTFCSTLYEDVGSWAPAFAELELPLHVWSIRRHGGISRESEAYIVISFRPNYDPENTSTDGLPERTFYIFKDADLRQVPSEQDLGSSTDSPESIAQCRRWMEICQSSHPNCRKTRNNAFTPTRLLDIGLAGNDATAPIRVVDTKATGLTGVKYATLSHCWGKTPFINLTPENEPILTTLGVPWTTLPKNFRQAIIVARQALSVRYIWIDSLCIIQGPHGDFHSEAALMHAVYRNSHCNLAAADSADSRGGLFRTRLPSSILPPTFTTPPPSSTTNPIFPPNTTFAVLPASLWQSRLLASPIYTRGWVFQERLLSPRLCHFTASQIFWDCGSLSACEALPHGLPAPLDAPAAADDRHWRARLQDAAGSLRQRPLAGPADASLEAFWAAAVRSYTACGLTSGADKLIAVWGIAKLVRDALGEAYGAGLWEARLEEQLAWRVDGGAAGWRPRPLRAPSWSWASLDGVVAVGERTAGGRRRCYVVGDHGGGAVRFQVVVEERAGGARPALGARRGSSWSEQFRAWDAQQREVGERRRRSWKVRRQESGESTATVLSSASSQVTDRGDLPPELKSWSIAVQGSVGRLKIFALEDSGKWAVDLPGMGPENLALEVFPDQQLPSPVHECCFVVLAMSRDGAEMNDEDEEELGDELSGEVLNEDEESEDIQPDGIGFETSKGIREESWGSEESSRPSEASRVSSDDTQPQAVPEAYEQLPTTFSGVGIIMQPTGEQNHFYRTGALQFKGIGLDILRTLERGYFHEACEALDKPHQEKGHNFWLD